MARDSTLSVVRHLETTLEQQGLSLIEARQASIRATMKARESAIAARLRRIVACRITDRPITCGDRRRSPIEKIKVYAR